VLEMQQTISIDTLFNSSHDRSYTKGQILLYLGEKTENVYFIRSGYVKVYDITANGDEKLLIILGPGDIFPLIWTFEKIDALQNFYETITEAEVSVVSRSSFIDIVEKNHTVTLYMLRYFVDRTSQLMARLACIESSSAKHKIAQVLLYLAAAHGDEVARHAYRVRISVTHQMIADMTGLNRSTASIHMKALETEKSFKETSTGGLIIYADRIEKFLEQET